nr:NADH dehydrogenase subunit 4 [Lepeophtheirus salmonis]
MFFLMSSFLLKAFFTAFNSSLPNFLISFPLIFSFMTLIPIYDISFNLSSSFFLDEVSAPILSMTILLLISIEMAALTSFYSNLLFFFSVLTFSVSNILFFYIAFELNLIPIFLIILGWGYQPERIFANKMMIMYTLMGSLPLLFVIIAGPHLSYFTFFFIAQSSSPSPIILLMTFMAFLVKLPIFSLHLWLPLAHVEAPLMGSMILAGVLLKLGGYGLIRFVHMNSFFLGFFTKMMISFSVVVAALAMMLCVTQVDMKVIIAYSSVGHMSMASATVFSLSSTGTSSAMINFVAHGFTSSLMFLAAGMFYLSSGTRHIILNKGMITTQPTLVKIWFLACLLNAGGPPTMNLMAEILSTMTLLNLFPLFLLPISIALILGMLFNMKLFSVASQGNSSENLIQLTSIPLTFFFSAAFHILSSALLVFATPMVIF